MSLRARLAWAGLALVATIALALTVTSRVLRPPVLMDVGLAAFDSDVSKTLPEDAQRVELELDADTTLRGWYLPADEGAKLVLHLLESSASVDSVYSSRVLAAGQLADLGFASLFLDYAGVGASSGTRSAANFPRDARAMWDEALRRVGGDPGRVVLRCTSIGTLAALPLLQGGARPAGVMLLLPVLPQTLAERFGESFYGAPAGWLARATFRTVVEEDMLEVVRTTPTAWLAVQAERDQMTSATERDAIDAAVAAAGGRTARLDEDHLIGSLVLRGVCDAEIEFLTEVVPGVRDEAARWARFTAGLPEDLREQALSDPARVADLRRLCGWSHSGEGRTLLALAGRVDDDRLALRLRWWLEEPRYRRLETEQLRSIADLADPAGAIPLDVVLAASRIGSLSSRTFSLRAIRRPHEIEQVSRDAVAGDGDAWEQIWSTLAGVQAGVELHPGNLLALLIAHGCSEAEARRQLARALLKAYAIPDRCVTAADGAVTVEFWAESAWHAIETDPSRPCVQTTPEMDAAVRKLMGLPAAD